jgi:hypothetical protein
MAMSVWGMIETYHGQYTVNSHARCIGWNEDHRLLLVLVWIRGVGFAHHDINFASGITGTAAPPFL